ncbi:MAG: DUF2334 domain-containing protein [Candidatus Thermoplasmatota archaeon]|nr:DUF2334 domain-containing protein [Candidatus Thermoplasmatota archaeon]
MKIQIHPLPYVSDIAFAIRDDDLSYFTSPEQLEKIYENTWRLGFKVSFAAIPMHKGTNNLNVPPIFRNDGKYYPIYNNEKLVNYIKKKISTNEIDILQHGFCHTEDTELPSLTFNLKKGNLSIYNRGKIDLAKYSEFYGANKQDIINKIEKGKKILEETFQVPIKMFVSPNEFLTKSIWQTLQKNNMNYCGDIGRNITQIPLNSLNIYPLLKVITKKFLKINPILIAEDIAHATDKIILISTFRHYWNKYLNDNSSKYWFDWFKTIFEKIKMQNGYFILQTHYWEYFYDWDEKITQKRQQMNLDKIIDYVSTNTNVWKCTISELADWITMRDCITMQKKSSHIKIFSPYNINGVSIQIDKKIKKHINKNFDIKNINDKYFIVLNMKANQNINLFS